MAASATTKVYSLEEVARHDGKDGRRVWIIYKDAVYDATGYEHPGGFELIMEFAGKDASIAFDNANHSSVARRDLQERKIGELRMSDRSQRLRGASSRSVKRADTPKEPRGST
ncbi:cytochrome b5-like [Tribolium madens]|uniref:cytochrome b5-like n=1 Tax=Tribolium madens TaxID=41895 RepID=UPI001CF7271B|nr:cytochrome b5-like [Tribolium madens]